jgi:hypothetical protein
VSLGSFTFFSFFLSFRPFFFLSLCTLSSSAAAASTALPFFGFLALPPLALPVVVGVKLSEVWSIPPETSSGGEPITSDIERLFRTKVALSYSKQRVSGAVARCEQTLPRAMRGQRGRATYPNDFGARLGSLSDDLGRMTFSLVRLRFLALLVRDRGVVVLAS